jgi:hypothetical protein
MKSSGDCSQSESNERDRKRRAGRKRRGFRRSYNKSLSGYKQQTCALMSRRFLGLHGMVVPCLILTGSSLGLHGPLAHADQMDPIAVDNVLDQTPSG